MSDRRVSSGVGEVRSQSGLHPRTGDTPTPHPTRRGWRTYGELTRIAKASWSSAEVESFLRDYYGDPLIEFRWVAAPGDARCCLSVPMRDERSATGNRRMLFLAAMLYDVMLQFEDATGPDHLYADDMRRAECVWADQYTAGDGQCETCNVALAAPSAIWWEGSRFCSTSCASRGSRREN